MIDGKQHYESTGVSNKRTAQKILDVRRAEVAEGRFNLLKKHTPTLEEWAEKYLKTVQHPNTRKRYAVSEASLLSFFGEGTKVEHISATKIEQLKNARREQNLRPFENPKL